MKDSKILITQRYDFFMFLAYLDGKNMKYARKVMDDQLLDEDKPILLDMEDRVNKDLEKDMFLYKGRNFQLYLAYLMTSETEEEKIAHLLELHEEVKRNFEINKKGIYSPRNN
jgi:hypothetical protein